MEKFQVITYQKEDKTFCCLLVICGKIHHITKGLNFVIARNSLLWETKMLPAHVHWLPIQYFEYATLYQYMDGQEITIVKGSIDTFLHQVRDLTSLIIKLNQRVKV